MHMAIDSGWYVYEQSSRINCSKWWDASHGSWSSVWVNMSAKGVKCQAPWTIPSTGYCAISDLPFSIQETMTAIIQQSFHFLNVNCDYKIDVSCFFPVASCTADSGNCKTCNDGGTACDTCDTGYAVDAKGFCRGNLFMYKVWLQLPKINHITLLVHFSIKGSKHVQRCLDLGIVFFYSTLLQFTQLYIWVVLQSLIVVRPVFAH